MFITWLSLHVLELLIIMSSVVYLDKVYLDGTEVMRVRLKIRRSLVQVPSNTNFSKFIYSQILYIL